MFHSAQPQALILRGDYSSCSSTPPRKQHSQARTTATAAAPSSRTAAAASTRTTVFCRLRPPIAEDGDEAAFAAADGTAALVLGERGTFGPFDGVLDSAASQEAVFEACGRPVVDATVRGEANGTILCYGQTGSGKTHSVGIHSDGLLPRALQHVFAARDGAPASERWTIHLSCMQIYLEQLQDLLNPGGAEDVRVREDAADPWGLVVVDGVVRVPLESVEHATQLVAHADGQRAVSATKMNWASSRSHAIYTLYIERERAPPDWRSLSLADAAGACSRTKLHIIDLAGSEKVRKIGDGGAAAAGGRTSSGRGGSSQLDETRATNLSLLAVGKMVHALAEGSGHVPFRESKLTRLLL
eukprot:3401324-Prymnesium_polylepis.1